MASQAQIDANRRNAQLSTGPTSPEGLARSSANATKHGLASEKLVDPAYRAEVMRRKSNWSDDLRPANLSGLFALDRLAVMSVRIERCENALDALFVARVAQARLDWDQSRKTEAIALAQGLAVRPELVAAKLQETRQGAELMLARWAILAESLDLGLWDDADRSLALDLLGVPHALRKPGLTPLDPRDASDPTAHVRRAIAAEVARLNGRIESVLTETDDLARAQAEASLAVLTSKPAALILRYERDAHRKFRRAMKEIHDNPRDNGPLTYRPDGRPWREPETAGPATPSNERPDTPGFDAIDAECAAPADVPASDRPHAGPNRRARRADAALRPA